MVQALVEGHGQRAAPEKVHALTRPFPTHGFERYEGRSSAYVVETMRCVLHF